METYTEDDLIEDLRPRLENWKLYFKDGKGGKSSAWEQMTRFLIPKEEEKSSRSYDEPARLNPLDLGIDDAMLLSDVWAHLPPYLNDSRGNPTIPIKLIISFYVFGSNKEWGYLRCRMLDVRESVMPRILKKCLVFFAGRISLTEWSKTYK